MRCLAPLVLLVALAGAEGTEGAAADLPAPTPGLFTEAVAAACRPAVATLEDVEAAGALAVLLLLLLLVPAVVRSAVELGATGRTDKLALLTISALTEADCEAAFALPLDKPFRVARAVSRSADTPLVKRSSSDSVPSVVRRRLFVAVGGQLRIGPTADVDALRFLGPGSVPNLGRVCTNCTT